MNFKLNAIGSDPELFLVNEEGQGVPSEQFFKGDKNNPEDRGGGFFLLCDNVMVEFNTPPSFTKEEFIANHFKALSMVKNELPDYINIDIVGSKDFRKDQLRSKLARQFGCQPDVDIWTESYNSSPNPKSLMRTASGHLHFSFNNPSIPRTLFLAKLCDYFLGIPSLFMDKDTRRREMYGKAGAVRIKDFGFEYRVLSNFWLESEANMNWVWDQIELMFKFANENPEFDFADSEDVITAINKYDLELASKVMEKYEKYFIKIKENATV